MRRPRTHAPVLPIAGGASAEDTAFTPERVGHLAAAVGVVLSPDRAAALAPQLSATLDALRGVQVAGYDDVVPAVIFRAAMEV